MAIGKKNIEKLSRDDIKSLTFIGVTIWLVVFLFSAVCLWAFPKFEKDINESNGEGNSTNIAEGLQSSEENDENSSQDENSTDISQNETETTIKETDEFVLNKKLTALPADWEGAAVQDYLQQMFFTNAASWGYKNGETPIELVREEIIHSRWGLPGGIWRQEEFLSDEIAIMEQYYSNTVAEGLYITELYEVDVTALAQKLENSGVHVNIIPEKVELAELGIDGLKNFVDIMHSNKISVGIYCDDATILKAYIDNGVDLDCVVLSSNMTSSGYRPCETLPSAIRTFYNGAIFMKANTDISGGAQPCKDFLCTAINAGCDVVSVEYRNGDNSARAVYAYSYLIEQERAKYEGNLGRLQESVLRILNLDRSLWQH